MRRIIFVIVLMMGTLFLTGCLSEPPLKVAIMTKLESGSLIGSSEVDAARMFLEQNQISSIEFIPFNDGWDKELVKTAYKEARAKGINVFITSHTSTCALELKTLTDLEQEEVLVIVTGSATTVLSGLDDNNIRVVQDVASEQRSIAEKIQSYGFEQLLIVRDLDNNKYTEPALEHFLKNYKGKTEVFDISIKSLDMEKLKEKMMASQYNAIYTLIGGNQTVSGSVGQLGWRLNPNIKIFYTPWNNASTILETAGESIDVSVMSNHYAVDGGEPRVKQYLEKFDNLYGYVPTYNSLHVYRALALLTDAVDNGHRDAQEIKNYMIQKSKFDTDFGPLTLDQYGDVDMPLYFIDNIKDAFLQ